MSGGLSDHRPEKTPLNDEGRPGRIGPRPLTDGVEVRYEPHTGHGAAPARAYSIAARRSCSASEAAAGSPLPPTEAQVPRSNWYLPR
jgi:hypothetical protein